MLQYINMKHRSVSKWFSSPKFLIVCMLLVLSSILIVSILLAYPAHAPEKTIPASETAITLEGTIVCLPHLNTDGPHTLECAYGLKTADNTYYALRDTIDHSVIGQLATDQKARVSGAFKNEPSEKYQDIGTITVEKVEILAE